VIIKQETRARHYFEVCETGPVFLGIFFLLISYRSILVMANAGEQKMPNKVEKLQQLVGGSVANRVYGKCAGLQALQAKVEELQRDNDRLKSDAQAAKQPRLSQPTLCDVFKTDVLVKRVMAFVGPNEYLFAASISRKCRQMQIVLSYKRAEGSKKAKLRTSFTAALASPARLQWAFSSGLKQKDKYYKPLQLVQSAMKASDNALSVLSLLNVQSLKKVDQQAASKLCVAASKQSDLELLKWLHAHECAWDAETCKWAAFKNRLDILQWAREQGCPWDEFTCFNAARKGHLHILQWARANGCAWNREDVLRVAAKCAGVEMLEWLQHNSGEPWSDADKALMLVEAGRRFLLTPLKWLRKRGAPWPASFIGSTTFLHVPPVKIGWTVPALKWALTNGHTWAAANWQCQQLAPELYVYPGCKKNAIQVFAWAHKSGCSCTCNSQQ
jgi:hypothetical protein